jgi:hypothetical protein
MAVINVTDGTQAVLTMGNTEALSLPGATNGLVVPTIQDITVGASTGTTRYSTLDSSASSAFTTVNENSVSLNLLVDGPVMFGLASAGGNNLTTDKGLFETSKDKTEVFFSVAFNQGNTTGEYYIKGKGFIGGLSPSASIDQAVWISPMEIVVNGELTKVIVS